MINLIDILHFKHQHSDCVRRLLSLRVIKENLRTHSYRSLSFLAKDFYELLNNARTVTSSDTQTWVDSMALGQLFEELKWQSSLPGTIPLIDGPGEGIGEGIGDVGGGRVSQGHGIRVFTEERLALLSSSSTTCSTSTSPTTSSSSSSGARKSNAMSRMTCSACSVRYFVTDWPHKAPISSTVTASNISSITTSASKDVGVEKKGRKNVSRGCALNPLSLGIKKSERRGQSTAYQLTEREKSLPYAWAIKLIASTSSETFTYPEGVELGKIQKDRRADREKKLNKEWKAAVAFLREKEKETKEKEKEKEREVTLIDATPTASPTPPGTTLFGWMCSHCVHPLPCTPGPVPGPQGSTFIPIRPLPQTPADSTASPPVPIPLPLPSFSLNNRAVLVWWNDDEEYYGGFINAFDSLTGSPCNSHFVSSKY